MTLEQIRSACPDAMTFGRARFLQARGRVGSVRTMASTVQGIVGDAARQFHVMVTVQKTGESLLCRCDCGAGRARPMLCAHGAALLMQADPQASAGAQYSQSSEALLAHYELEAAREGCLRLQAQIEGGSPFELGLRVGVKRLYVIGDLHTFFHSMHCGEEIRMGKGLVIDPQSQGFAPSCQPLAEFVQALLSQHALYVGMQGALRQLPMTDEQLCELLEILEDQTFILKQEDRTHTIEGVREGAPGVLFSLSERGDSLVLSAQNTARMQPLDSRGHFVLCRGEVMRLGERQARALAPFWESGESEFVFSGAQKSRLLGEVIPQLRTAGEVRMDPTLAGRVVRQPLLPRVTLDIQGGEVTAQVCFAYGALSIDPFGPAPAMEGEQALLERDAAMERQILDVFSRHGFRVRSGGAYLSGDAGIYEFLTEGVPALQGMCEVFSSTALLSLRPRRARPAGRLSVRGGMLEFSLAMEEVPPGDYPQVLEALREKRTYVRVSTGAFLSLRADDGWAELADYLAEAGGRMEAGVLRMERSRAAYLDILLGASNLRIERDEQVRGIAQALSHPQEEEPPIEGMRPYQARGFSWLCALARLQMGGILADDMGLGKTVQVLSLIEWGRREQGSAPTLVVAPTSLVFNWLAEVKKFTPHLRATALGGSAAERREQAAQAGEYDLIVTSYAQVRRDIEFLQEIEFRYVILDEAQHIKNAASVGAENVKQLRAQARFALSGTPMENHLGELWSLFDFVLPGYLSEQSEFLRRFGDGRDAELLQRRIRPFLLRRLKRHVLTELPEKIEHRITAELTPEQRDVYYATLLQSRTELAEAIERQGFEKSRMRVLAAITRLRQICCHPSLALEGYEGGSGKLELLMELMREAAEGGRRVLLFSQFTSMLGMIGEEFTRAGIEYFYLDGSTPMLTRGELVNRFNAGERGAFLISLRAGGTGLNLHTADTVIHYDPWWNPAVEDQATDRAHRIGQVKAVHVIKLVSRGTIEEKIFDLKGKKQQLIDSVVTPGEVTPGQLTAKEILSFFDDPE